MNRVKLHSIVLGLVVCGLLTSTIVFTLTDRVANPAIAQTPPQRERPDSFQPGRPGRPGFDQRVSVDREFEKPPLAKDETEQKILDVLNDLRQNQSRGNMNVPENDGRLLRMLAESLDAKRVVELGTSNGYSGIWISLALLKTGGRLITHEIDEGRAALARENFKRAGVENIVTIVMGDAHENVKQLEGPIDLVFIDADKEGYHDYLVKLMPKVRPGGLIVAHNMSRPAADPVFLQAITTNPELETLFFHMDSAGVSVSMKKR